MISQKQQLKTDQLFTDDAAKRGLVDWYKFEDKEFDRKCGWCTKAFTTRLLMNIYCSPECRNSNLRPTEKL